jgi:hypothetical protein
MPTALQQKSKEHEGQAAYERWVQSELTGDSRLTVLRVLHNDILHHGQVRPETWDYFDMQEDTGAAESMNTQHITELEGEYDSATDEIVAATAGGERVTYDSFTVSGVVRAKERAAQNPDFGFQVIRDEIFHDNFHGPIKEMWRGNPNYDTVIYVSTFADDVIEELGDRGRLLLKELAYDEDNEKGFMYGYRKNKLTGNMDGFAVRVGNGTRKYFGAYLQKRGKTAEELEGLSSHEYGRMTIYLNTGDTPMSEVAKAEVGIFDEAAEELTGEKHHYGREEMGIDAYELFKKIPNIRQAYKHYHLLLAEHLAGLPLHDDLYDYLVTTHTTMGFHVLNERERIRLDQQLSNGKVTADMALACKKLMTYPHYATLGKKLEEYRQTGTVADIGGDIMQSYGGEANDNGGAAAARGETFSDCESSYGEEGPGNAVEMASRMGISMEEAMRRLMRQFERWSQGECRNCERDTQIWAEQDGGCSVCRKCANEHTIWGQQGLDREKRRAQAERERDERWKPLLRELEESAVKPDADETKVGTTRYSAGEQQMLVRRHTIGGAKNVWVATATGQTVDAE